MSIKFEYYDGGYNLLQLSFGSKGANTDLIIPPEDLNLLTSMTLGAQRLGTSYSKKFGWNRKNMGTFHRVKLSKSVNRELHSLGYFEYTVSVRDSALADDLDAKEIPLELFVRTRCIDSVMAAFQGLATRSLDPSWRFSFTKREAKKFTRWLAEAAVANNMMNFVPGDETWSAVSDNVYPATDEQVFDMWRNQIKTGLYAT